MPGATPIAVAMSAWVQVGDVAEGDRPVAGGSAALGWRRPGRDPIRAAGRAVRSGTSGDRPRPAEPAEASPSRVGGHREHPGRRVVERPVVPALEGLHEGVGGHVLGVVAVAQHHPEVGDQPGPGRPVPVVERRWPGVGHLRRSVHRLLHTRTEVPRRPFCLVPEAAGLRRRRRWGGLRPGQDGRLADGDTHRRRACVYLLQHLHQESHEHHRAHRRPGDPRLPGQPHRGGGGRPRLRRAWPGGGALGRLDRSVRGGRAARRRRPLRRQGRQHRRRQRQHRDPRRAAGPRRPRPARHRPGAPRPRRHRQQGPTRRQRHPRRVARRGQGGRRRAGDPALPPRRRHQRPRAAGADDERAQRWRPRRQQRGLPGVHDHADRRGVVLRGAAVGRRDLPRAQGRPARQGPVHRRRRRGRLRPRPGVQRGAARPARRGDREGRLHARRGHRDRPRPGDLRGLRGRQLRPRRRGSHAHVGRDGRLLGRHGRAATRSCRSRTGWPRRTGTAGRS